MDPIEKADAAQRLKHYETLFPGHDRKGIAELYDTWASQTYEQDIEAVEHRGRFVVSETLARAYPGDVGTARVLDVASGTGMLAEALLKQGFRQIDALDGSRVMLDKAKPKQLYRQYFCNFMEDVDGVIADATYDIVVSLASIGPGHLESTSVLQMFRITKPGGLICICGVKERWDGNPEYHQRMRGVITELETNNKIKILEDRAVDEYYFHKEWTKGILIVMRKV